MFFIPLIIWYHQSCMSEKLKRASIDDWACNQDKDVVTSIFVFLQLFNWINLVLMEISVFVRLSQGKRENSIFVFGIV